MLVRRSAELADGAAGRDLRLRGRRVLDRAGHERHLRLRVELHDKGIRVSVLCPAFFRTNLLESWQGNPRLKSFADKMMETSPDTLESVSDAVFAAASEPPTTAEAMMSSS